MLPRPDLGPKPSLGYSDSRLERAAERRGDAKALAAMAADAKAGAYVIGGDLIVAKKGAPLNNPLFTMSEAKATPRDRNDFSRDRLAPGSASPAAAAEALKTHGGFVTDSFDRGARVSRPTICRRSPRPRRCTGIAPHFCPNCGGRSRRGVGNAPARTQGRAFPTHRPGGNHACR
jgi:hypothetical protein